MLAACYLIIHNLTGKVNKIRQPEKRITILVKLAFQAIISLLQNQIITQNHKCKTLITPVQQSNKKYYRLKVKKKCIKWLDMTYHHSIAIK